MNSDNHTKSENPIGQALAKFDQSVQTIAADLERFAPLHAYIFQDTAEWRDLLTYKLVPHLEGEGCLIAAVAGGTNTGKSTIFNILSGSEISPMVNTAAATCHPVIAANRFRADQCLGSKLVPEFDPKPLDAAENLTDSNIDFSTLYITEVETLPDHLIIMDTPDVDSIDKRNWEVADHIRAAGDVLIAVVTGEKYKDDRIVQFFREAAATGRTLIPVMNKANPAEDFAVARKQLEEFKSDVGTDGPLFAIAHDFDIASDLDRNIEGLEDTPDLRTYLESMDVPAIKQHVFANTVTHFANSTDGFLDTLSTAKAELDETVLEYEARIDAAAESYAPAPGKEVGGLFHEFVQSKRGNIRRTIGSASAAITRGATALSRTIAKSIQKRSTLDTDEQETQDTIDEFHRNAIKQITQDTLRDCIESTRELPDHLSTLATEHFDAVDTDALLDAIIRDTLSGENISDEFREHAEVMLNAWWQDHKGKRLALEALDTVLAIMPAAIAGVAGIFTQGFGAGELALASTAAGATFGAKVMEYQFGDALFDFLSPWRKEQQEKLAAALKTHLLEPALEDLRAATEALNDERIENLRQYHNQCATAPEATA